MAEPASQESVGPVATPSPPTCLWIGPFTVRAAAAEIEAFRKKAFGDQAPAWSDTAVPFTFPVRWFTHPDIRAAGAAQLAGFEPWVPIHESQSFEYDHPLKVDIDYRMMVEISREYEPARLILRAEIGAEHGICLRAEMILRIIRIGAENAP